MDVAKRSPIGLLVATSLLVLLWAHLFASLLTCLDGCFTDYVAVRGDAFGRIEAADARLNAWILGWVQHALLGASGSLFDANVFYPYPNALAASEHLLGIALPLLPLGAAGAGPVALHQIALAASYLLTALTTLALVRWLTGSDFAAFAAGAAALFMPWRISELSHVQLLSCQWFPLIWLMLGRILYCDRPRAAAVWLSLLVTLQVLTSFYLAYFLLVSGALLVTLLALRTGLDRSALRRLCGAAALPALALGLVAIPYLTWQSTSGFVPGTELFESVTPADAWSMLRPAFAVELGASWPRPVRYGVPLAVSALALLALLPAGADCRESRRRGFAIGLWGICALAFVLVLGRELRIGGVTIPLPAEGLARLVPGFDHLRSPLRWGVLIGLASPVLAGIGLFRLERLVSGGRRQALRAAVGVALALSLPSARIPARPVWPDPAPVDALYAALAALPDAPVVEIPWPIGITQNVALASRYMLASTRHWKPIANGTSGYYPPTYALMSEVASRLPEPHALEQLRRLVDARWIVVHGELLVPGQRRDWTRAAQEGRVRPVYQRGLRRIYELPRDADTGRYLPALRSTQPRARTFAGLPRTPLALAAPGGRLEASVTGPLFVREGSRLPNLVALTITNASDRTWPAFDLDARGTVRVRYSFEDPGGETALTDSAGLIVDPPPGQTRTTLTLKPPARVGRYRLRLELVQEQAGELRPLPVTPAELDVEVREARLPDSES